MHQKGETVTILNQNLDGIPTIEGEALLLFYIDAKIHIGVDGNTYFLEKWKVMFENDGCVVTRWLYPECDIEVIKS